MRPGRESDIPRPVPRWAARFVKRAVLAAAMLMALFIGTAPPRAEALHGDSHTAPGTLLTSAPAMVKTTWRLTATNKLFGDSRTAYSDTAYDTVQSLSGVDIMSALETAYIRPQDTYVFIKHIRNLGNSPDTYTLKSDSTQGLVRGFFIDIDGDSAVDGSDPPFTTLVLRDGAETAVLMRVDAAPSAVDGAQDSIRLVVSSNAASDTAYLLLIVDSQPPTTPAQISPVNSIETTSQRPAFVWTASTDTRSGLAYYRIEVDSVGTYAWPVVSETTTLTTFTADTVLGQGRYYWRVRAYDKVGNFTGISDSFTFVVDSSVSVSLTAPVAGLDTSSAIIRYVWSSTDAETYTWQLSTSAAFTTLADSVVDTKTTDMIRALPFQDTFYWRVIATDTAGSYDTTAARRITLDSSVEQITALTPSAGNETTVTTVVLAWSAVSDSAGIDSYVVEVSNTASFATTVQVDTLSASRTSDTLTGLYNDTYFWRVRGIDGFGNAGSNSVIRGFVVDTFTGQVVLASPVSGGVVGTARPELSWAALTDSVGIDSYMVEVSASPTFATVAFNDTVSGEVTSDTPTVNLANGLFYWRVRAVDNLRTVGAVSDTFTFTVSTAVTLTLDSPADGHETNASVITFAWTSEGAETYTWQISRTPTFVTVIDAVTDTTDTSITKTFTVEDTYFWRVIGRDRVGNADTKVRGFVIDSSVGGVTASLPADGHETSTAPVVVSWLAVADSVGIDSYAVEVSRTLAFTTLVFADTIDGARTSDTLTGLGNDTYYWRVRAVDNLGRVGAVSDTRGFVIDTFVAKISLLLPADNHDTNKTKPVVSWTAITDSVGIDSYAIEVSKSSSFSSLVFADTVSSSRTSDTLSNLYNDTYYWRVRAIDRLRNVGAHSDTRRLRVDTQSSAITLLTPSDSFATSKSTPSLTWSATAPTGIASFSLRIARTSAFTTLSFQDTLAGTVFADTASALKEDTYFWKLIATDNVGSTTVSSIQSFIVDITPPTAPIHVIPANNHETSNLKPVFRWTASNDTGSGVYGYRLEISRDSKFATITFVSDTVRGQLETAPVTDLVSDTYYWRVVAIDNAGNTTVSASRVIALMDPNGSISFDKTEYKGYREIAQIRLTDPLANTSPVLIDVADITVLSDVDPVGFTIQLVETGSNTNLFVGTIQFTGGNGDVTNRKVKVAPGSGVSVTRTQTNGKTISGSARWLPETGLEVQTDVTKARSWPNPWNPTLGEPLVIQNLPADPGMTIEIYTLDGTKIRSLYNGRGITASAFGNVAQWDGRNDGGQYVASGVYLYVVRSQFGTTVKKITLVK